MSHTPGPWTVSPLRAEVLCSEFGRDGDLLPVARMLWPTDERSEVETEANAYLVAAAPELLSALRWLRAFWQPGSDHDTQEVQHALASADAALAKATGAA